MSYDNASAALEDRSVSAEAPRKNRDEFRAEKVATVSGRVGPDFGKIEALAVLPNRTMCGTKPSQIGQPRSSRSPEGNCNHKQVWRDEAAPKVGLCLTCHALTGMRHAAEDFCAIALGRDAVARAGGRFELPAVFEHRERSGCGDDKPSFNCGFIDAVRISALRQEAHLGR